MSVAPSLIERIEWRIRRACLAKPAHRWRGISKDEPLVVAGFLSTASGIGQAARGTIKALRALGYDPVTVDLSPVFGQRDLLPAPNFSTMPKGRSGTLILHVNAPETQRSLDALGMHIGRWWRTIGVWAWELPSVPKEWLSAAQYLSELWTPSDFVTDVFAPHLGIEVHTVPHYIPVPDLSTSSRLEFLNFDLQADDILCLIMADGRSSFERKNVIGAVHMYLEAFAAGTGPLLVLKSRNLAEYPDFKKELDALIDGTARIKCLDQSLTHAELKALQERCDILLSPHRSEGFGLHLAECMAEGCAVITTGWSGNMQFTKPGGAEILPYELVPVTDPFQVYAGREEAVWAAPDHKAGVAALQKLFSDQVYREKMGHQARRDVSDHLGTDIYRTRLQTCSA